MNQEQIGLFISKCRKKQNLTQKELADKIGVTDSAISKWERGKGLPDLSLLESLTKELNITLNEFFAAKNISNKELTKTSENNIKNIMNYYKDKRKRFKLYIIVATIIITLLLIIVGNFTLVKIGYLPDSNLKYTKLYLPEEEGIKGAVDYKRFAKISLDFEIGANKYGIAVFKDPNKALKRLKKDYKKSLKLIQKEFGLLPLNIFNYRHYKTYGWQVTTGTKEEQEKARFISSFFDIYENSFN